MLLGDTLADDWPTSALRAHEINLRIDHDERGTLEIESHVRVHQDRLRGTCVCGGGRTRGCRVRRREDHGGDREEACPSSGLGALLDHDRVSVGCGVSQVECCKSNRLESTCGGLNTSCVSACIRWAPITVV